MNRLLFIVMLFSVSYGVTFKDIMTMPEEDYIVLGHSIVIKSSLAKLNKEELISFYDLADGSIMKRVGYMSFSNPKYSRSDLDLLLNKSGFKNKLLIYTASSKEADEASTSRVLVSVSSFLYLTLIILMVVFLMFSLWITNKKYRT